MDEILKLNNSDRTSIATLLESHNLPVSDLETAPVVFYGITKDEQLIAIGALEIIKPVALLRSVAVHPDHQKKGLGKQIITFLENKAKELNIQRLYLLTTTAESFFSQLNYQEISRDLCPSEIQSTSEYSALCPSSAVCFYKAIL
ncbi:arsenic resistance N-acetyltransferase ArsN2 [Maribellus sediminis]|uniref:arsenic resistance N-acetyltransferase ArsN2 n=1 Tax=Maribellus sediminis TaxID=2696285 RepID=UPI0014313993|nr:arsenic resistance N-acetyltransferase ArsN2 [Maribellus sediminis]